ncbi:MAG: SRPBCC family protein [Phycisphaerales bacterium]
MNTLTLTKRINADPARVFVVSTNVPEFSKVVPSIKRIEVLTPGPVGKGTRFKETRVMFGKEATETLEFTDFSPPSGYTIGCTSCGVRYATRFDIRAAPQGTDLTMTMDCQPVSLFAKIMGPITGALMKSAMTKALDGDLECIKKAAEGG